MDYQQQTHTRTRSMAGPVKQGAGLSVRTGPRIPLGEIKSSDNNKWPQKPQTFTIFEDKAETKSGNAKVQDENACSHPPPQLPTFGGLRQSGTASSSSTVWPPPPQVMDKNYWPPPPPIPVPCSSTSGATASLPFTIYEDKPESSKSEARPQAPIGHERSLSRSLNCSNESADNLENLESLVPSYARAEFRQNNESILSTSPLSGAYDESCGEDDSPMAVEASMSEVVSAVVAAPTESICDVDEYTLDIVVHTRKVERKYLPKWNYMSKQPDITYTMRSILVDWLIEVGEEYRLHTETLFLAVNYIDRFLSFMSVQRAKLQLVGTACMFLAAKYEEIYPPEVSEFCYITDDTYTKKQVLRMEHLVLEVLGFECSPPTSHFFANHFAKLSGCADDSEAKCLAQYLAELTLLDAQTYLHFLPSVIGAASVALARHTLGLAAWDSSMVAKTGYRVDDFKACLICLHESFTNAPNCPQQAVHEKYKNEKYHMVSQLRPTPIF